MKRVTFKKMQEIHPEFEFVKTNDTGHIKVTHKATGKQAVCIIGNRVKDYNRFVENAKANPDFYLGNKSFFRHVVPTTPSPYKDGQQVEVVAAQEDLDYHFGKGKDFCSPGDNLTIKSSHWCSLSEEWHASFDNPKDFGGFWLQKWMIK